MPRTTVLLLVIATTSCGGGTPTGPSTPTPVITPPAAQTYTLSGRVTDVATAHGVQAARVQFMTGINAGRLAIAESDGRYTLRELRAGSGLVRAYGPQHTAAVERTLTIPADAAVDFTLTATVPWSATSPLTYTGTVWDSRGTPVSGAAVRMIRDSGANPLAIVASGADGTFTVTTQTTANSIRVSREGFVPVENVAPLPLASPTLVNVAIPRIARYVLQDIPALRVGQSATLMTVVDTDDGLTSIGRAYEATTSSNEAVAAMAGLGSVVARAPGTTTLSATYSGLTATLSLQVVP